MIDIVLTMINENFLTNEMKTVYIYTTRLAISAKESSEFGLQNQKAPSLEI